MEIHVQGVEEKRLPVRALYKAVVALGGGGGDVGSLERRKSNQQ
jgi:hypothetical protein